MHFSFCKWAICLSSCCCPSQSYTSVVGSANQRHAGLCQWKLCFWPVASVALGLDPIYPHNNLHWYISSLSGRLCKLPHCGEHSFLIETSLWDYTDYPSSYLDYKLPMSLWNSEQTLLLNIWYNTKAAACCQVMIRGMTP